MSVGSVCVLGGGGALGRHVVKALFARKIKKPTSVSFASRDPQPLKIRGAKPQPRALAFDFDNLEAIREEIMAAEKLVLITPEGRLSECASDCARLARIIQAPESKVKHVVKISCAGAGAAGGSVATSMPAAWHTEGEQELRSCGARLTFLRPTMFYSSILQASAEAIRLQDRFVSPLGWSDARVNFVAEQDVAAVASVVLGDDNDRDSSEPRAIDIFGPDNVTGGELAKIITWGVKRKVDYKGLAPEEVKAHIGSVTNVSEETLDGVVDLWRYARDGGFDTRSDVILKMTGQYPAGLGEYLEDCAQELGDTF